MKLRQREFEGKWSFHFFLSGEGDTLFLIVELICFIIAEVLQRSASGWPERV